MKTLGKTPAPSGDSLKASFMEKPCLPLKGGLKIFYIFLEIPDLLDLFSFYLDKMGFYGRNSWTYPGTNRPYLDLAKMRSNDAIPCFPVQWLLKCDMSKDDIVFGKRRTKISHKGYQGKYAALCLPYIL